MKVKLLVRQRIWHDAGETVEVSPEFADFLLSIKAAEMIMAEKKTPTKKETTKKKG